MNEKCTFIILHALEQEAERLRFEQRRAGMAVIEEQLYEREQARLRAADILAQVGNTGML